MTGLIESADLVADKFRKIYERVSIVSSAASMINAHSRLSEATKSPSGLDMGVGGE